MTIPSLSTRAIAACALVPVLLAACASGGGGGLYDQPYALIEADQRSVPADTRSAFVLKVDGEDRTINRSDPVSPGMRTVVVSVPGARGMSESRQETIMVDAKPCMRYYLAARRSSATASDWSPFIAGTEPIGECRKKFPSAN